jgi:hypothetical protein
MVVTLEVSRLSGWLNADMDCRVKGEASKERPRGGRAWRSGGGANSVPGRPKSVEQLPAGRARAKRTINILSMVLTLEVSRLSGWLNADAYCRAKREV